MKLTAHLWNPQQGHKAYADLWTAIKPHLVAGWRIRITAEQETRSSDQNAKLHAELGEIAERVPWAGQLRDVEVWKRLMTAAWLRARGESIELLPALDGHGVDVVFRRTSTLTKAEMSELLEFVLAWKAEHMRQPNE